MCIIVCLFIKNPNYLHSDASMGPDKAAPIPLLSLNLVDDGTPDGPKSPVESLDEGLLEDDNEDRSPNEGPEDTSMVHTAKPAAEAVMSQVVMTSRGHVRKTWTFEDLSSCICRESVSYEERRDTAVRIQCKVMTCEVKYVCLSLANSNHRLLNLLLLVPSYLSSNQGPCP